MRDPQEVLRGVSRKEIWRYLGYSRIRPDSRVDGVIDSCLEELLQAAEPRAVWRDFALRSGEDGSLAVVRPELDGLGQEQELVEMEIRSRSLSRNLEGCGRVYLMAATLGPGPDRLVRRAQIVHLSHTVFYQAIGAALIEEWCDEVNREIIREGRERGLYARPRFSPGYGDLPLELQRDFMRILRMQKEIGVTLTDSLLMTPAKSVTALIGMSGTDRDCPVSGCAACARGKDCAYKREDA